MNPNDDRINQELGYFDDESSLANINIIQIANSGLSPQSHVIAKNRKLKSKFTQETSAHMTR